VVRDAAGTGVRAVAHFHRRLLAPDGRQGLHPDDSADAKGRPRIMSAPKASAPKATPAGEPYPITEELAYFEFAELSQRTLKRPLVLFFGRPTFADNTKYLYLAALKANTGCEVIWCGFNKPLLTQLK